MLYFSHQTPAPDTQAPELGPFASRLSLHGPQVLKLDSQRWKSLKERMHATGRNLSGPQPFSLSLKSLGSRARVPLTKYSHWTTGSLFIVFTPFCLHHYCVVPCSMRGNHNFLVISSCFLQILNVCRFRKRRPFSTIAYFLVFVLFSLYICCIPFICGAVLEFV